MGTLLHPGTGQLADGDIHERPVGPLDHGPLLLEAVHHAGLSSTEEEQQGERQARRKVAGTGAVRR